MLVLSEQDVSQLLLHLNQDECNRLLKSLSSALVRFSAQSSSGSQSEAIIHQPLRSTITTKEKHTSLFMPVSNTTSTGIKIVTLSGSTGEIRGVINVFTPEGRLAGLLSAAEITAFRTALATMTLLLRCPSIHKGHICIFGAGKQAEWHARLALLLFPEEITTVTFVNRRAGRFERLVSIRQSHPQIKINFLAKEGNDKYHTELESYLALSDVVFCCTPSTEPLFPSNYLTTGSHRSAFISLIGSYKPHMQEVDSKTLLSGEEGKVYVDSKEACLAEAGELIMAKVDEEQLVELGELFEPERNQSSINPPVGRNVVFKCVGMGIMDLTVANTLLEMAAEKGLGLEVAGF